MAYVSSVVDAARAELVRSREVLDLVGSDEMTEWVFQWKLYRPLKSTGKSAIVVSARGPWAPPNGHNTAEFPRIVVDVYVDPTRDPQTQEVVRQDAETRAIEIARTARKLLHRPFGPQWTDVLDDGCRVLTSQALDEPDVLPVSDGDGMVMGRVSFALVVG